jgi:hypothetical protein
MLGGLSTVAAASFVRAELDACEAVDVATRKSGKGRTGDR